MTIPTLPPGFYDQHPTLRHIRQAAQHERTAPDVTLGAVLCRVATMIRPDATANGSQVNYLTAIVGPPGAGKTTGTKVATKLLPELGTVLDRVPPGSGEGIVQRYLERTKDDEGVTNTQVHTAALFHTDEGEQLLQVSGRQGSTTLATIRSMWVGETVGNSNANPETSRLLRADSYRFAMTVGLQPGFASDLLSHSTAGDPQRYLWVGAADPTAPDTPPPWPGPLTALHVVSSPAQIAPEIAQEIDARRVDSLRQGGHADPQKAHEGLLIIRTAAILATLFGTPGEIDALSWIPACELVEHSAQVTTHLASLTQAQQLERDAQWIDRTLTRDEIRDQKKTERVTRNLARAVQNRTWLRSDLRRDGLNSRDRYLFDDALRLAFERGWITATGDDLRAGPVRPADF
jgi:hypothetical protein